MRAYEFVKENEINKHTGWQDNPEIIILPYNLGKIVFGIFYTENGIVADVQFLYYNENLNSKQDEYEHLVFGLRIKNGRLIQYDYQINKNGLDIGPVKSLHEIKEYFNNKVSEYLQNITLKESHMQEKQKIKLFDLVPGLEEKMDRILKAYEYSQKTSKHNETKNMDESAIKRQNKTEKF